MRNMETTPRVIVYLFAKYVMNEYYDAKTANFIFKLTLVQ